MSFGWVAVASLALTAHSTEQQRKAGSQARTHALADAKAAEEANNKANARKPDSAAAMAAAILAGKSGQSGTMLTGPQGIDPNSLMLGKATLLGGGKG